MYMFVQVRFIQRFVYLCVRARESMFKCVRVYVCLCECALCDSDFLGVEYHLLIG